jgi:serine/threonine protein kinase
MNGAETQNLLKRYRVMEPLGEGGAGRTFRGVDTATHRDVAIKVLSLKKTRDWKKFDLFEREVAVLKTLRHPGIPRYIDSFEATDSGDFFLVMELVEGRSLADGIVEQRRFTPSELRALFEQLLDILDYLHSLSPPVIHRDIKPANIVVDHDHRVHLVDFGGVRVAARGEGGSTMFGTFGYMAPEQLHGDASEASDLYSLAATIVALHAGQEADKLPHDGLRLDMDGLSLPPALAPTLAKMLEPEPKARLKSVSEVRMELRRSPASPTASAEPEVPPARAVVPRPSSDVAEVAPPFAALARVPAPLSILVWITTALGAGILTVFEVVVLPLIFRLMHEGKRERVARVENEVRGVRRALAAVAEQTNPLRHEKDEKKEPGQ